MRKKISKQERELVYLKYDGHCAYCGKKIDYKEMQVDHINAVYQAEYYGKEVDNSLENYNPACRQCNFYKDTFTIEEFRYNIKHTLIRKLERDFNYKMLIKYGLLEQHDIPVTFYFEKDKRICQ